MRSVDDRNVVMRRIPVFIYLFIYLSILFGLFNDCQYTHHTTPKSKINEMITEKIYIYTHTHKEVVMVQLQNSLGFARKGLKTP